MRKSGFTSLALGIVALGAAALNSPAQAHVTDTPFGQVTDANRLPDNSVDNRRFCGKSKLSERETLVCVSPELRALWQEDLDLVSMLFGWLSPTEQHALGQEIKNRKEPCEAVTVDCTRTRFQMYGAWLRERSNEYKQQAEAKSDGDINRPFRAATITDVCLVEKSRKVPDRASQVICTDPR